MITKIQRMLEEEGVGNPVYEAKFIFSKGRFNIFKHEGINGERAICSDGCLDFVGELHGVKNSVATWMIQLDERRKVDCIFVAEYSDPEQTVSEICEVLENMGSSVR